MDNDPERLFTLMHGLISIYPSFETTLAPRLVLGLWHPKYVEPAVRILPYIRLAHIGMSPALARRHFWDACGSFSMNFASLVGSDGELFRKECKLGGKDLCESPRYERQENDTDEVIDVWTVNKRSEMIEATKWGAKAILTDRTAEFLQLRAQMEGRFCSRLQLHARTNSSSSLADDWSAVSSETTWKFAYTSIWYSSLANVCPSLISRRRPVLTFLTAVPPLAMGAVRPHQVRRRLQGQGSMIDVSLLPPFPFLTHTPVRFPLLSL